MVNNGKSAETRQELAWRRVDLHIHTPASTACYAEPEVTLLQILRRAEEKGLDIMAITDHNSVAGYAAMRKEIEDLELLERLDRMAPEERARLDEYRRLSGRILVLPGFEFTATLGFHILGIFPPNSTIRQLESVLMRLNVPENRLDEGATDIGATTDVLSAYRVLAEAGGLVIAAHANSSHGVAMSTYNFGGQTKISNTQDRNLHALEVTDLDSKKRGNTAWFFSGVKPEYPRRMHCIQSSDAHTLAGHEKRTEVLGVGDRPTEVLLDTVSFDSLKGLLLGSEFHRTRPYSHLPPDAIRDARMAGPGPTQAFWEHLPARGPRREELIRDVAALANSEGGVVYIGVSGQARFHPRGVERPDEAAGELREEIAHRIVPRVPVQIEVKASEGKPVLVVHVPRGTDTPYTLTSGVIVVRRGDLSVPASRDDIVRLVDRARGAEEARPASEAPRAMPGEPAPAAPAPALPRERDSRRGRGRDRDGRANNGRAAETPREQRPAVESLREQRSPEPPVAPAAVSQPVALEPVESEPVVELEPYVEPVVAVAPPKTGAEVVRSVERNGVKSHTMRDLRNGGTQENVTRTQARHLWHYAICQEEDRPVRAEDVTWRGDIGLWKSYVRQGTRRYNLVQRDVDGGLHVYYGVTQDGLHGPWRELADSLAHAEAAAAASAPPTAEAAMPTLAGAVAAVESVPSVAGAEAQVLPEAAASFPAGADQDEVPGEPPVTAPAAESVAAQLAEAEIATPELVTEELAEAKPASSRSRGTRRGGRGRRREAEPTVETAPGESVAEAGTIEPLAGVAEPEALAASVATPDRQPTVSAAPAVAQETEAALVEPAPVSEPDLATSQAPPDMVEPGPALVEPAPRLEAMPVGEEPVAAAVAAEPELAAAEPAPKPRTRRGGRRKAVLEPTEPEALASGPGPEPVIEAVVTPEAIGGGPSAEAPADYSLAMEAEAAPAAGAAPSVEEGTAIEEAKPKPRRRAPSRRKAASAAAAPAESATSEAAGAVES